MEDNGDIPNWNSSRSAIYTNISTDVSSNIPFLNRTPVNEYSQNSFVQDRHSNAPNKLRFRNRIETSASNFVNENLEYDQQRTLRNQDNQFYSKSQTFSSNRNNNKLKQSQIAETGTNEEENSMNDRYQTSFAPERNSNAPNKFRFRNRNETSASNFVNENLEFDQQRTLRNQDNQFYLKSQNFRSNQNNAKFKKSRNAETSANHGENSGYFNHGSNFKYNGRNKFANQDCRNLEESEELPRNESKGESSEGHTREENVKGNYSKKINRNPGGYNSKQKILNDKKQEYSREIRPNKYHNHRRNEDTFKPVSITDKSGLNQRESLIWQLSQNKYECMICVTNIRGEAATWSCDNCYHIFHIGCINKWASTCGNAADKTDAKMIVRCPACQKEHDCGNETKDKMQRWIYRCFCGKQTNPTLKRGRVAHSCDEPCGRAIKTGSGNCPHLCPILCHPGPCPPCEAIMTRDCHCGVTRITTKCQADAKQLECGAQCKKWLNCGRHQCDSLCHVGECEPCVVVVTSECWCDRRIMTQRICGSDDWRDGLATNQQSSCGEPCDRLLACGNHRCDMNCHEGDCVQCQLSPELSNHCPCGKWTVQELLGSERQSCLDPVPNCGEKCQRKLTKCDHSCEKMCGHNGECEPCPKSRDVPCRCGKSIQNEIACERIASGEPPIVCNKLCHEKLLCGRHRCGERCCASELHLCLVPCGRMLTCKRHPCERECGHLGSCPPCSNVSFDELHCECGAATSLPPIACGQSRPVCSRLCSRSHTCNHPVRHQCHSEPNCPPCTQLMSKSCPGNHRVLDNVPCFRSVATCGLVCGQPLSGCRHSCTRICHQDDCLGDTGKCSQPCKRPRSDCGHPCAAPCHDGACQSFMINCVHQVILNCSCKLRSIAISCTKLQNAISILKFTNSSDTKRDSLDIVLSGPNGSASLTCDAECKKLARNLKLADAFDISITASNLSTYYSESIKHFAKKNVQFLLSSEKMLLDLVKNLKNTTDMVYCHTIKNITEDKTDFVTRYAACFKISCKCNLDQAKKLCLMIEVNRSNCCVPKPLLSDLLKAECPHLFPVKPEVERNNSPSTTSLTMSFADRIRLSKKE